MDRAPFERADIHVGLKSTLVMLAGKLDGLRSSRTSTASLPPVPVYGGELNQVWTNLIDNAVQAMDGAGTLTIRTSLDGDHVRVEIGDTGPGIPTELRQRIFEPFFTTKPVGQGTGLGLDISYRIVVARHGGDLTVESRARRHPLHRPAAADRAPRPLTLRQRSRNDCRAACPLPPRRDTPCPASGTTTSWPPGACAASRCAHSSGVDRSRPPASSRVGTSGRSPPRCRPGVRDRRPRQALPHEPVARSRSRRRTGRGRSAESLATAASTAASRPASGAADVPHGNVQSEQSALACSPWLSSFAGPWNPSR